jgi:hypothetical protein
MLKILVPSDGEAGLTFSAFEKYGIPAPPSGVDEEINDDVILQFDDEEQAIIYAAQLENMAEQINDKTTTQYLAINDIIVAIRDDEFVQSYIK